MNSQLAKLVVLCSLALLAFAGNSILCRLALATGAIDAVSFTGIRMLSAVIILFPMLWWLDRDNSNKLETKECGDWLAACALFSYAALFSLAYVSMDTATGALVLFGSVQISMIAIGRFKGTRVASMELLGMAVALVGFVYLVIPDLSKPSVLGFVLMAGSGLAWAIYTVRGQASKQPLRATAFNFLRTAPLVTLMLVLLAGEVATSMHGITQWGIMLAIASGALTSGIGYAIWYAALPSLSTTQAAVMQLLVPIIAAVGGVIFADEPVSLRLVVAGVLVLGGILLVIAGRLIVERAKQLR